MQCLNTKNSKCLLGCWVPSSIIVLGGPQVRTFRLLVDRWVHGLTAHALLFTARYFELGANAAPACRKTWLIACCIWRHTLTQALTLRYSCIWRKWCIAGTCPSATRTDARQRIGVLHLWLLCVFACVNGASESPSPLVPHPWKKRETKKKQKIMHKLTIKIYIRHIILLIRFLQNILKYLNSPRKRKRQKNNFPCVLSSCHVQLYYSYTTGSSVEGLFKQRHVVFTVSPDWIPPHHASL